VQQDVDHVHQRLAVIAELNHGDADQHRNQDDLQHHSLGEGLHDRGRDDVE
jgi:hypothetical protein